MYTRTSVDFVLFLIVHIAQPIDCTGDSQTIRPYPNPSFVVGCAIADYGQASRWALCMYARPDLNQSLHAFLRMDAAAEHHIARLRNIALRNLLDVHSAVNCKNSRPHCFGEVAQI